MQMRWPRWRTEQENGPCEYVWKYTNRKIASIVIIAKYASVTQNEIKKREREEKICACGGIKREQREGRERIFDFSSTNRDGGTFIATGPPHTHNAAYDREKRGFTDNPMTVNL